MNCFSGALSSADVRVCHKAASPNPFKHVVQVRTPLLPPLEIRLALIHQLCSSFFCLLELRAAPAPVNWPLLVCQWSEAGQSSRSHVDPNNPSWLSASLPNTQHDLWSSSLHARFICVSAQTEINQQWMFPPSLRPVQQVYVLDQGPLGNTHKYEGVVLCVLPR